MKKLLVLLLALSLAFSIVACGGKTNPPVSTETQGADPEAAKYGGVLDIAIHTDPGSIDPHYTSGTEFYKYSNNVFENPLAQDAKGNIVANVCEYELSEDGLTLKLCDTAGIHDTDDRVEQLGVERSRRALEQAELVLVVLDGSRQSAEEEAALLSAAEKAPHALVVMSSTD